MEGILEGGPFSPPIPKLRVEGGRTREQSVYNYFYLLFLESSSTWQQGGDDTVGKSILIPSAQRLVWAAKQPLGNAALGALFA